MSSAPAVIPVGIFNNIIFFIPHHMIVVGYYGITLAVHVSVGLSIRLVRMLFARTFLFMFTDNNLNKCQFSPNLACALILWRSSLGLLMGKFCQFLTQLSACDMSVFSFLDDNLSKFQWIFTKFDMCIDIVDIWFGIAHWQILSIFEQLSARNIIKAGYYRFMFLFILGHEMAGVCSVHIMHMCICGSLCLLNSCCVFCHL